MPKSFKSFTKEYALGLHVPATSNLTPTMSMNLHAKKKITKEKKDKLHNKQKKSKIITRWRLTNYNGHSSNRCQRFRKHHR